MLRKSWKQGSLIYEETSLLEMVDLLKQNGLTETQ